MTIQVHFEAPVRAERALQPPSRERLCRARSIVLLLAALGGSALGCLAPDAVPGGASAGYDLEWAKSYGLDEDADRRALSVAATPEGGALVAGEFEGTLAISPLPELPYADVR